MTSNYTTIIRTNVKKLYGEDIAQHALAMQAQLSGQIMTLKAFGAQGCISRDGITLDGQPEHGPRSIILSLYALHATSAEPQLEPLKAFKELPDSMPYAGAFANRTEQALVPAVERIVLAREKIIAHLDGGDAPSHAGGDLSFVVRPLPKIALCYLFYEADDDFPAAATCLYSSNANHFLPTDALADVGEYTSRAILDLIKAN